MPPFLTRRPARRASTPYPIRATFDRAIRAFFPELPDTNSRPVDMNDSAPFLGAQGQSLDVDSPLIVSSFRPLVELPTFHNFDPSPNHPIPASASQSLSAPDPFLGGPPRVSASPAFQNSPPSFHRADSPLFLPLSPPPGLPMTVNLESSAAGPVPVSPSFLIVFDCHLSLG